MAEVVPNQMRIFVSHSRQDNDACRTLVNALREAGADVWYDEHNMTSGRLGQTIERELRARPIFIVMLSPAALASSWVEDETRWAYNLMRRDPMRIMLPVVCETVSEDGIWLFLQEFKRIEAPGGKPFPEEERHWQTLRALALTPKGQASVALTPQPTASVDDLMTQGRALEAQERYSEAVPFFQRATQLYSTSGLTWARLAYTLAKLSRWEEALAAAERTTELEPNDDSAWTVKAAILGSLGRENESLTACERALAIDPNYAPAWIIKAGALRALGRKREAEEAKRRAKELGG
jgi:tetratricopeptide (TPR) repeat protein